MHFIEEETNGTQKKDGGLVEIFTLLPWEASLIAGVVAFFVMYWVIPGLFASSPLLLRLAVLSRSLSWLGLLLFAVTGVIAFSRAKRAPSFFDKTVPSTLKKRRRPAAKDDLSCVDPALKRTKNLDQPASVPYNGGFAFGHAGIKPDQFAKWTVEALQELEWKRFELVCAKYYEFVGFRSETIRAGADGGIDIKLFKIDPPSP